MYAGSPGQFSRASFFISFISSFLIIFFFSLFFFFSGQGDGVFFTAQVKIVLFSGIFSRLINSDLY